MGESRSILDRIAELYPAMSPSQRLIADVILRDPESSAFCNVADLARQAGVSESTVTRFATFLGCKGFPGLSRSLQEIVRRRLTTGQRFQLTTSLGQAEQQIVQHFRQDLQNIALMMERMDPEAFARARDRLVESPRIGVVCSRSTVSLGQFFQFYLHLLGKDVTLFTGDPRTIDLLQRFGTNDVMVGIGFSRYARWTVEHLRYARKKESWIMVITDYPSSPLVPLADEAFFTPTGIPSHLDSLVAPLSFLTGLLRAVSSQMSQQAADILQEMEDLWAQFGIYEPPSSI